jgi:hypothetical protein
MLKLHHMNLLNEIQETTLMMNLYQQQQIQQQQQQLQQQGGDGLLSGDIASSISHLLQNGGGPEQMIMMQRASLGLGGPMPGATGNFGNAAQMHALQQQQLMAGGVHGGGGSGSGSQQSLNHNNPGAESAPDLEGRIAQLKQDIARGDAPEEDKKRSTEDVKEARSKRAKTEDDIEKVNVSTV